MKETDIEDEPLRTRVQTWVLIKVEFKEARLQWALNLLGSCIAVFVRLW